MNLFFIKVINFSQIFLKMVINFFFIIVIKIYYQVIFIL